MRRSIHKVKSLFVLSVELLRGHVLPQFCFVKTGNHLSQGSQRIAYELSEFSLRIASAAFCDVQRYGVNGSSNLRG